MSTFSSTSWILETTQWSWQTRPCWSWRANHPPVDKYGYRNDYTSKLLFVYGLRRSKKTHTHTKGWQHMAQYSTKLFPAKLTIRTGEWYLRTLYRRFTDAKEMDRYNIKILGLSGGLWAISEMTTSSFGYTIIRSGNHQQRYRLLGFQKPRRG